MTVSIMRRWASRWIPGLVFTFVGLLVSWVPPNWLWNLELQTYDLRMHYVPGRPDSRIVIVTVDTRTLNEFGPSPVPRHLYTDLIKRLSGAGAKVIGVDVNFVRPDPQEDDALAAAIDRKS